jgi:hypothetical protein
MEVARAAAAVIAGARALGPDDFALPTEAPDARTSTEPALLSAAQELLDRAGVAASHLATVRTTLDGAQSALAASPDDPSQADALRGALRGAAAFLPGSAFPTPGMSAADLLASAQAVGGELGRRADADTAVVVPADGGQARVDAAVARLQAMFGRGLRVVPSFVPPAAPELQQALDAQSELLDNHDDAPGIFLQQAAAVRPALGRFRQLSLYTTALGTARPAVNVMQLPLLSGETWVGLPFAEGTAPPPNRLSLVALTPNGETLTPADTWRGLMLDEWVELIPSPTEATAVAFHYDNPGAEAGHAVLVAVPARPGQNWTLDDLVAAVDETFDLAQVRAVDAQMLSLGQLLPGIYFAQNSQVVHTASTDWAGTLFGAIGAVLGGVGA